MPIPDQIKILIFLPILVSLIVCLVETLYLIKVMHTIWDSTFCQSLIRSRLAPRGKSSPDCQFHFLRLTYFLLKFALRKDLRLTYFLFKKRFLSTSYPKKHPLRFHDNPKSDISSIEVWNWNKGICHIDLTVLNPGMC